MESAGLTGADETVPAPEHALSGCVSAQAQLETTAPLNLRQGPSTGSPIVLTLSEGAALSVAAESCPDNGFYKVRFGGFEGWAYGAWLHASTGTLESALSYANTRTDAMARARTVVGFSYWWGGGRWLETGATSTNKGSCTGSCGNCTHSGSYGADCSGFAAKVWVVPSTNQPVSLGSHPYSTVAFDNEYHGWHNVERGNIQMADAMVYNVDGAGHIFIYEKGDPWGNMYAYECKGCSEGCVYNIRSASNSYKAIGRDGITAGASSGGDGNVYAVMRAATGTGTTEVHVLNRATNYQSFIYETGTALHETGTDGSWMFRMGDYNNDGKQDLWAIAKNAVQTDVHILDGATNFQSFLLHAATGLHNTGTDLTWVFLVGDYNGDGRKDLYAVNKNANGKTDVHVLNGADNFKTFLLHAVSGSANIGTDNSQMLDLADFNNDGKLDLWVISKAATGSGTTEVHVLNGADNFATYILHSSTALGLTGTDGRWYFSVADYNGDGRPDLYATNKAATASGKTEIHVLNGADGFKTFLLHSTSALGVTGTDHRWVFDL
ncbi:LYCV glycosyl hydrolase [Archangium gephyra]|uniref:LYCV glycosyl hydrolase n=2 Tax=Archangium gephyra TaxID=48 RepID=A0AAC8TI73_9BACT|nr:FG-GAP-like repeat-containing protein [Archangium gephyra]AKJ07037.1 LYCV glycosyl hydrolase [Archangium gephyra]